MKEIRYQVTNPMGLHARCASLVAQCAVERRRAVTMTSKGKTVNGKQVLDILGLAVLGGDEVVVQVEGPDEDDAIRQLSTLLPKLFG